MLTNHHGLRVPLARGHAFDVGRLLTDEILVECGQERFYVSTRDEDVGRTLFVWKDVDHESFERTFALIAQRGHELADRIFLDVGANIGTRSVRAITRLGCSHVFAFEPSGRNGRLLEQNIVANGLERQITPVRAAVSDASGEARLGSRNTAGRWGVAGSGVTAHNGREVAPVAARSLDDWLEESGVDVESVGAVWIDAQGREPYVLAGASRVLASDTPVVCRFWPYGLRAAKGLEQMCDFLAACDRQITDLGPPSQVCNALVLGKNDLRLLTDRYTGVRDFGDLLLLAT
jgi:FkbM family methyltransferase